MAYLTRLDCLEKVEVVNLIKQETSQIVGKTKKRKSPTSGGHST